MFVHLGACPSIVQTSLQLDLSAGSVGASPKTLARCQGGRETETYAVGSARVQADIRAAFARLSFVSSVLLVCYTAPKSEF